MTPRAAAALLDLLIDRAPALHAAGITSVSLDGIAATLAPPPAPAVQAEQPAPAPQHTDPLRDPASYPGGRVPGFAKPKEPS